MGCVCVCVCVCVFVLCACVCVCGVLFVVCVCVCVCVLHGSSAIHVLLIFLFFLLCSMLFAYAEMLFWRGDEDKAHEYYIRWVNVNFPGTFSFWALSSYSFFCPFVPGRVHEIRREALGDDNPQVRGKKKKNTLKDKNCSFGH